MKNRKKSMIILLLSLGLINLCAQKITISGYISDSDSGERLIGANVFELSSATGAFTNEHGFYSLTLPKRGNLNLIFSYIGYQIDTLSLVLTKDSVLQVRLAPTVTLSAVEVRADARNPIQQSTQMSEVDMPVKDIQRLPAILGEVDVIKALQLMPGVQGGNEGFAGLYVRGGSPDQNLVLLDGVPIYNPTHVLGIFSVFNPDAIKNVSLLKGGFPARYGGRLSSVLNINMKDGNLKRFQGEGSVSNIAAKLTLEGPIRKESTSFLIAARRTYLDAFLSPVLKGISDLDKLQLYFYDLNGKLQHRINNQHSLHLSLYAGKDIYQVASTTEEIQERASSGLSWQNQLAALRWNYTITNKVFANTTLSYTDYQLLNERAFENLKEKEEIRARYTSGVRDYALRTVVEIIPTTKHYIRLGGNIISHTYRPGASTIRQETASEQKDTLFGISELYSTEYNTFLEDEWQINPYFSTNIGLHYAGFLIDDEHYTSLQPRLSLRLQVSPRLAFKSSFVFMTQYINLLSSETIGLPSDLWVPSTSLIPPQNAWQWAGGIAGSIRNDWEFTVEGFYKKMDNIIAYEEGASFQTNLEEDWQDKVAIGTGEVYGAEFFLNKKAGKTTGWIGYTLSWNWRQFDELNLGRRYPFRYDRRHDFSLVLMHQQNDRISYSFSWVYATGNAVTLPEARYALSPDYLARDLQRDAEERFVISERNGYRMSPTHRLDANISFYKKKTNYERTWTFGVYNVYSRINPFYVNQTNIPSYDPVTEEFNVIKQLTEVGILPIIPSVGYHVKF
jgi:outer membrane cobalamin receptor